MLLGANPGTVCVQCVQILDVDHENQWSAVLTVYTVMYNRGGNGNPLQYSCLENPMDRGAWQATVHRVAKSPT